MNDDIRSAGGSANGDTTINTDARDGASPQASEPENLGEAQDADDARDGKTDAECGEEEGRETRGERKKLRRLESEIEGTKKQLAAAEAALAVSGDKYYRMLAEYDNFRKRSAKEKECSYSDAYADALSLILPVIDNLERARGYTDAESVTKGIELMLKSLGEALERLGIREIGEVGEKFDPNLHNAVFHIEDEKYGEGEVVEVLLKGYTKGDRVVRYAMVKVAN